jgi:hypothetical protein
LIIPFPGQEPDRQSRPTTQRFWPFINQASQSRGRTLVPSLSCYLVLLETSGNQRHIFETNKLRENIGASQQIYQAGGKDVLDAVRAAGGPDLSRPEDVADGARNPPIEKEGTKVEVWYLSSGKAMLLVRERETGVRIVRRLTTKALRDYPGVTVRGTVSEAFVLSDASDAAARESLIHLNEAVKKVHESLAAKRSTARAPEARFPRMPVVADCRSSGLPASSWDGEGNKQVLVSMVAKGKRKLAESARTRMQGLVDPKGEIRLPQNLDDLEASLGASRYLAVIHADGNGIGRIFESFSDYCGDPPQGTPGWRHLIHSVRHFSMALDECTRLAFQNSVREIAQTRREFVDADLRKEGWQVALLPLILGGDDVTIVCAGQVAVPLLVEFLRQFERLVEAAPALRDIAAKSNGGFFRLGMAAGVALVKPHYPFFSAYSLASDLADATKRFVKTRVIRSPGPGEEPAVVPCTAFDFHVHHSPSGDDLTLIRDELTRTRRHEGSGTTEERLWGGPWIATPDSELQLSDFGVSQRAWSRLKRRVQAIVCTDPDDESRRSIPASQLYDLRSMLFEGREACDSKLNLISHRDPAFKALLERTETRWSAFWQDVSEGSYVSSILDAMALAKLDPAAAGAWDGSNDGEGNS